MNLCQYYYETVNTYCVELTADEAVAAEAAEVRFSQPIIYYVENFLNFPVGGIVPVGYYDRSKGIWVASDNGRIIRIVSMSNGMAELDTDGDGIIDNGVTIGITDAERQKLFGLYQPGQSLWRFLISHFSTWDANWPFGPPAGAEEPKQPETKTSNVTNDPCIEKGSNIECQNQILGEAIPIIGTPFTLHYQSDRVPGRLDANALEIPLTGDLLPPGLKRIDLEILVGGNLFTQSFPTAPNQQYTFVWNNRDAYGRIIQGKQPATVRIGYVYDAFYLEPADLPQAFNMLSGKINSINRARYGEEITLWQEQNMYIGGWDAREQGFGVWTLSAQHAYDPVGKILYMGDGRRRKALSVNRVIVTVAGNGAKSPSGDGGPAIDAGVPYPTDVAVGSDGSLYIASFGFIRRVWPNGTITAMVATPFSGVTGIDIGPDGSIYVAESATNFIRRVWPNGTIDVVAGNGNRGYGGDSGPATEATLGVVRDVALGPDGSIYIADTYNYRIRKVGTNGIINTVAGNGLHAGGGAGDGGPATDAQLCWPYNIDVGSDGSLYIADTCARRLRKVSTNGIIRAVAGNGVTGFSGDGGPALDAEGSYTDVAAAPDNSFYFADSFNDRIRWVNTSGIINTIAGGGDPEDGLGDGGPAKQAKFGGVSAWKFTTARDGSLYVADTNNHRVRKIMPPWPGYDANDIAIPSDDGKLLYRFTPEGRHLSTMNAMTGSVLLQFVYDTAGHLIQVVDGDGNITVVGRDPDGNPKDILGPYGQRTNLSLDTNAYLSSITNPAGEANNFIFTNEGLLTRMTDPRGSQYQFAYDSLGRLVRDDDPAGGFQTLTRNDLSGGFEVIRTTALNRVVGYQLKNVSAGGESQINTFSDGTSSKSLTSADGRTTTSLPEGTSTLLVEGPDPRFYMQAPVQKLQTITTPGGSVHTTNVKRSVQLSDSNNPMSLIALTETTDINGHSFSRIYDASTRTFTDKTPEGRQSMTTTDDFGRVVRQQADGLDAISYTYDSRGRLSVITQGVNERSRSTSYSYKSNGYLDTVTDPLGRRVSFSYDGAGRITKKVLPDGSNIFFGYDLNGNMTSIVPPGRLAHCFTYSPLNFQATYVPPDVGAGVNQTQYIRNGDRQLRQILRPDNLAIDFSYDSAGRLEAKILPQGQISYAYNPTTGNLASITAPYSVITSFSYDGGLLTGETWSGPIAGSISRTYDKDFRITSMNVNNEGGPLNFQYDNDGLLIRAANLNLIRNALNGLLSGTSIGNLNDVYTYNSFSEITGYSAAYNGAAFYTTQYFRDKLGRITQKTEVSGGQTNTYNYNYNLAGYLTEVRKNNLTIAQYSYDSNGNRNSYISPNGSTISGIYDDQDRLIKYGNTDYTYTANGELLTKTKEGLTSTYQYDALGNLTGVTLPGGKHIEYLVDGKNRRLGKKINGTLVQGFLYKDDLFPLVELNNNNEVISVFIYASRTNIPDLIVKNGILYRIIPDNIGSPKFVVRVNNGQIVQKMEYDAFGNVILDTINCLIIIWTLCSILCGFRMIVGANALRSFLNKTQMTDHCAMKLFLVRYNLLPNRIVFQIIPDPFIRI